jgi:iron complex outermembrane receptor protein
VRSEPMDETRRPGRHPAQYILKITNDRSPPCAFCSLNIRHAAWLPLALGGLLAYSSGAYAEPVAPNASSAQALQNNRSSEGTLDEIIVTATKRSVLLQEVPASIVALSAQELLASGVKGLADVAALTPGVEFDRSAGGPLTNISIRGIDSTIGATTTGIYINDTAIQSRVNAASAIGSPLPLVFDLQRVEVDRGPQGTLFGAGAEGGALRFITNEPGLDRLSGQATVEASSTRYGSASYEAGAAAGGPIIDNVVGFRASAWYRSDGGYIDRINPFTGGTVEPNSNGLDSEAARIAVLIQPYGGLRITPSVYYQSRYSHDADIYYPAQSDPNAGEFRNGKLLAQPTRDHFTLSTVKIEATGSVVDLTSITSYFDRRAQTLTDTTQIIGLVGGSVGLGGGAGGFGNPLGPAYPASYADAGPQYNGLNQSFISEEFRLASADAHARLSWVAGLFYIDARQHEPSNVYSNDVTSINGLPQGTSVLESDVTIVDHQYALFGQADLKLTDKLKLTGGVRVARTTFDSVAYAAGIFTTGVPPVATGSASETPVTPKFGISYQADRDNLYYFSAAKGYRVGGVNVPVPSYCTGSAPSTYNSDSLWSYELGAKNTLFNGHLQIDTSAFHIDWSNVQQPVVLANCGYTYLTNTGQARSDGFDLAAIALVGAHTKFGLSVAYTNSRFTKTVVSDGLVVVQSGDSIGLLPEVPSPFNATVYAEYRLFFGNSTEGFFRAEDIFNNRNPGPFSTQIPGGVSYSPTLVANPSINILNLRAGLTFDPYEVTLFANNVLNAHPALSTYLDAPNSTLYYNTTLRPLTIGVNANVKF